MMAKLVINGVSLLEKFLKPVKKKKIKKSSKRKKRHHQKRPTVRIPYEFRNFGELPIFGKPSPVKTVSKVLSLT